MRRFVAAALGAAALSATVLATSGTANAASAGTPAPGSQAAQQGSGQQPTTGGGFTTRASRPAPKPSSKKHYFTVGGVTGAYTTGDWYWTRDNGPFKIVVEYTVHDTKADHKVAGFVLSWTYQGKQWGYWSADLKGAGTSQYYWDAFLPAVTGTHGFSMVGTVKATPTPSNPNQKTFFYTARGPWVSIRK